ncbi:uncharacterized protein LOC108903671 [Anoplophora glabripennis]|uniref:uncharacterized protein LOC108903671 n=1 Tax=Anoplophora glabripennis TaxID=217634 RepID=UPI0008759494|nr:uncharacterized protein LOC108903671 [Anoplophora glabripennis]
MVERKNRDLKPRLAIMVGDDHTSWIDKLSTIRFAMNSVYCATTGSTAAYLTFGRELRTPDDIHNDIRTVVQSENLLPQITPFLDKIAATWKEAKELYDLEQDRQKQYSDQKRTAAPLNQIGDKVWVTTHTHSDSKKGITSKFDPKRDVPYDICRQVSPVSFEICDPESPTIPLGVYHVSALTPHLGTGNDKPQIAIKKLGRPPKKKKILVPCRDDLCNQRGRL